MSVNKLTGAEKDAAKLKEIAAYMRSWNELSQTITLELPTAVAAAVMAGRPELVDAAISEARRPMYIALLKLVRVLLETNLALQEHASETARRTLMLTESAQAVLTAIRRVDNFANFRTTHYEDDSAPFWRGIDGDQK